jgi:hypothetical protein
MSFGLIGTADLIFAQQPRQFGDVRCDPSRLIFGEQFRRRSPLRLVLKIDVGERLAAVLLR